MTWLKVDDRIAEHRKIRRLSDAAFRLHITALAYCAKDETDGLVTEADFDEMEHGRRLRKHVPSLIDMGLWEPVPGGWVIHDYLHYNPSHAKQNEKRAKDRERQERWRENKASQRDNGVTGALSHIPVPSRPVPTRPDPVSGGQPSPSRHLANDARAALKAAENAKPGVANLGDVLGLGASR